jgi:dimethylamine monooxygenase subunit A
LKIAIFTIRTFIHPIHTLVAHPSIAAHLLTAIQQIPEAMQRYKNLRSIWSALLQYLTQHSQAE